MTLKTGSKDFSRNGLVIATGIIFSRITGFFRDIVFASILEIGLLSDVFLASFKFPNLFRRIFADGGLVTSFVPVFSKYIKEDRSVAVKFASKILSAILVIVGIFIIILLLFMDKVTLFLNPGFSPDALTLATRCSKISILFLFIAVLNALFGGMLNTISKFQYYAFSTVIFNVGIILFCLIAFVESSTFDILTLMSISILVGGFLSMLFMLFGIHRHDLMPSIKKPEWNKDVKSVLSGILYTIPSSGILNVFIDSIFASFFLGGLSYVYYSDRIMNMPISIIGYTIGTLILPMLSKAIIIGDQKEVKKIHKKAFFTGMVFAIPTVFILIFFSRNILEFLYSGSRLGLKDFETISEILKVYSVAIPAIIISKICMSSYFASRHEKIQFKSSIVGILINISMILLLMKRFGLISMFYATSTSSWVTCFINIYYLRKKNVHNFIKPKYLLYSISLIAISLISVKLSLSIDLDFLPFYIKKIAPVSIFSFFYIINLSAIFGIYLLYRRKKRDSE